MTAPTKLLFLEVDAGDKVLMQDALIGVSLPGADGRAIPELLAKV